jgi:hypothetical protein
MCELCRDGAVAVVQQIHAALRTACGGQVNVVMMAWHLLVLPCHPLDGGRCVHFIDQ